MSNSLKYLLWLVGGVVGLMIIATVGLKLFFPLEKVKQMATEMAQSKLGRPLSIGGADVSIFSGLGVHLTDVSLGNPSGFTGDPFVAAKSVDVKVAFWPLLSGNIRVSRLVVESPTVSMHKRENGSTNYTFAAVDSTLPEGAATIPAEAKPAAAAIAFDGIEISNGVVTFVDDSAARTINVRGVGLSTAVANPGTGTYHATGKLVVDTLLLSASQKLPPLQLAIDYDAWYDMNQGSLTMDKVMLGLNGLLFEITGKLGNMNTAMNADVRVKSDKVRAADLIKLLPPDKLAAMTDFTLDGDFAFDAHATYDTLKTPVLAYDGTATITDFSMTKQGLTGDLKVKRIPLAFSTDRTHLTIEHGEFAGTPLGGFLDVSDFSNPLIDGAIDGILDLALLQPLLPQTGNPQLSGRAAVDLSFTGRPKEAASMTVAGELTIADCSYMNSLLPEPITHFDAYLVLAKDTISVNKLNVKFVSSDASFSGKLIKPFPYLLPMKNIDRSKLAKPFFQFALTSHHFDNDKLFPEASPGSAENRASLPADSVPPIILPDIDGQGTFQIDTLVYSKVDLTQIVGKIKIYDRKIEAYDVTGKVYTGSVAGSTTIDLNDFNNPKYSGKYAATQIEANDFIARFCKVSGFLYGKFDVKGDYSAAGWEPQQFLNSMSMSSLGAIQEGKLVTSGVVYTLLDNIAKKIGKPFDKEQPLRSLTSNIRVQDGKVIVDGLKANLANIGDLQLGGFYGFDNQIGYDGTIQLTKELTSQLASQGGVLGGLTGLLSDKSSGRLLVPLKVTGTMDKPEASVDFSALTKSAGENVKQNAKDALKGLFKKK